MPGVTYRKDVFKCPLKKIRLNLLSKYMTQEYVVLVFILAGVLFAFCFVSN